MHYRDRGYWDIIIATVTVRLKVVQLLLISTDERAVVGERGGRGGEGDMLVGERSGGGVRTNGDWDGRHGMLMGSLLRPFF
jgi:hypothetical protein